MARVVAIDPHEITITPVFKILEVENVPKSEVAGHAVMETKEVVEVRFAGSKNYSPIFPVDAFWKREGNRVITYGDRTSTTSELQSLMRISYAVFCLKTKKYTI